MTSSEPIVVPPTGGQERFVLAQGTLHPAMLLLRFLDGLRASLLPGVMALVTREPWLAGVAIMIFVLTLLGAIVRFATFQYRLDTEELVTREGILNRQERRIPVNRIQDLGFEQSLLRRGLGLVVVTVETASGKGAEARLDSLSRRDAEHMREALYRARGRTSGAPEATPGELVLWRAPATELLLLGLSTQRVGALLAAGFGVLELLRELRLVDQATGVFKSLSGTIVGMAPWLQAVLFVAAVCGVLTLAACVAVGGAFLLFHGFFLTLRDDVLVRRYGLVTRHVNVLPRRKIQRVLLDQTWLRYLLGRAVVKAESAGGGESETEKQKSGTDVLAPLLPYGDAMRLVGWALPGADVLATAWQGVSPRAIVRMVLLGCVAAFALFVAATPRLGWFALLFLLLIPLAALVGFLTWRRAAWALEGEHVLLRSGLLGRTIAIVPARKVQAVVLRAGPLDRLLGMARIVVYVAGGSATTLAHLVRGDAERLLVVMARRVAAAKFVW